MPIHPTPANPDTMGLLRLDDESSPLRKPSYLKLGATMRIPPRYLSPFKDSHRNDPLLSAESFRVVRKIQDLLACNHDVHEIKYLLDHGHDIHEIYDQLACNNVAPPELPDEEEEGWERVVGVRQLKRLPRNAGSAATSAACTRSSWRSVESLRGRAAEQGLGPPSSPAVKASRVSLDSGSRFSVLSDME